MKKGEPGPIKAKVHVTRAKQMVLAFFDAKGLIYTNYVPRGTTVNATYIVKALGSFMKILKKKRPGMAAGKWFLHWDNAPVHTAASVTDWLVARRVTMLKHPPYSPDLAPADFYLFPKVKKELASLTLTSETFKKEWEGAVRTAPRCSSSGFAAAISVSGSAAVTWRKHKNKHVPSYRCFLIDLLGHTPYLCKSLQLGTPKVYRIPPHCKIEEKRLTEFSRWFRSLWQSTRNYSLLQ